MADDRSRTGGRYYGGGYGREQERNQGHYGSYERDYGNDDRRYGQDYGSEGNRGNRDYGQETYGEERYGGRHDRDYATTTGGYGAERYGRGYGGEARGGYRDQGLGRDFSASSRYYGQGSRNTDAGDVGYGAGYGTEAVGGSGTSRGGYGTYGSQGYGEHRGRGPKGYQRSDDRIREDVSDRLSDDDSVDASEIEVSVSNCEVTLTGTVESREQKRRAEDCVESVSGVKNVQNNLRIAAQQGASSGTQSGTTGTSRTGSIGSSDT